MMGGMGKRVVGPVQAACGAHVLHWGAGDFRTVRRYFIDFVLPALILAGICMLTAVLLVVVVSAVADMEVSVKGRQASPDLWRTASFGPAFADQSQAHPAAPVGMDALDADEFWLDPQANDQLDSPRLALE